MDFNTFAQDRKDCHVAEGSFLIWRIAAASSFVPSVLYQQRGYLIAHILVWDGEMSVRYGSEEYSLGPSNFANFIDKSRLELLSATPGIQAFVMVFTEAYADGLLKNHPPMPFSYLLRIRRQPVFCLDRDSQSLFIRRMETIRETCRNTGHLFHEKMVKCALWMLLMDVSDFHVREESLSGHDSGSDRTMSLFYRFMKLLSVHAATEHFASFYADQLCVTPQYLNRIVKAVSGRTVSGWIHFHLVGEITRRLENTGDTMQQIAADCNFPDQSTLTKFYKRETGYTLTEYKKNSRQ